MRLRRAGVEEAQADLAVAQREIGARHRGTIAAPSAPARGELRQELLDIAADQPLGAQQPLRLRIVLHDLALPVEHQHAVVHVALHELVHPHLRGERAAALGSEPLVRGDAPRQPAGDAGRRETAHGE